MRQYINGTLLKGCGVEMAVRNPATGEKILRYPGASPKQAVQALEEARAAFPQW